MLHVPSKILMVEALNLMLQRMKPSSFKKPKMRSSSAEPSWMFHLLEVAEAVLDVGQRDTSHYQLWIRVFG
jgi:hypothetical protein